MIRDALVRDVRDIQNLVNNFAKQGVMLSLSLNDIFERLLNFIVYEENGIILGACALSPTWEDVAEIRSLAVHPSRQKSGVGRLLVDDIAHRAKLRGFNKVFALTYRDDFFGKLGFKVISIDTLPKKIWTDCLKCVKFPNCDEIAMEKEI